MSPLHAILATAESQTAMKMGCFGTKHQSKLEEKYVFSKGAYRYARAVRKVGHSPPLIGSFLGVGLPQGTIAIVYPCSINPPPSCVSLQTGTLGPVYGDCGYALSYPAIVPMLIYGTP